MEFVQIKCPGCGADVSTRDEVCEYCGKPVIIRNFTSIASMSMPELNRYVGSYKRN
ncbi:MAG: zinc ribbon domain-containing protein [Streptococcus sp.]